MYYGITSSVKINIEHKGDSLPPRPGRCRRAGARCARRPTAPRPPRRLPGRRSSSPPPSTANAANPSIRPTRAQPAWTAGGSDSDTAPQEENVCGLEHLLGGCLQTSRNMDIQTAPLACRYVGRTIRLSPDIIKDINRTTMLGGLARRASASVAGVLRSSSAMVRYCLGQRTIKSRAGWQLVFN